MATDARVIMGSDWWRAHMRDQDTEEDLSHLPNPIRELGVYRLEEALLMSGDGRRPILLGMNNPLSTNPEHALYPDPPGCAGHRLMRLLGLGEDEYLARFERRNLLSARIWSPSGAAAEAEKYRAGRDSDRHVVLLGEDVARLMWHGGEPFCWRRSPSGGWWAKMPHPSGRCRHWNDPVVTAAAEIFLQELAEIS